MNTLADNWPRTETTVTGTPNAPALPVAPRKICVRCNGKREVPMVARGRKGGNAGGVIMVRCPACGGKGV